MKNIVFILPDQLRADFVGCYGAEFAKTKNIDNLAKKGIVFDRAISPSPLCVPARASLLTGKNAIENGVLYNDVWLRADHEACGIKTWPKLLSENGYQTIGVGKMHFYPWDSLEGFDKRVIDEDKRHIRVEDDYCSYLKSKGLRKYHGKEVEGYRENLGAIVNPLKREDQADSWITREACNQIDERDREKPFAMMVGLVSPHCPYDADINDLAAINSDDIPNPIKATNESKSFRSDMIKGNKEPWCDLDYTIFPEEIKRKIRYHYSATVHHVDECVGKIVDKLEVEGLLDDTIIIFASDHGDFIGDFDLIGKTYFYEPAVHIPLIIYDKDLKYHRDNTYVSLTDIRATILNIAGLDVQDSEDSKVLPPYSSGENISERWIMGATDKGVMISNGIIKYCRYTNNQIHLFDLSSDPFEQTNLANDISYREILREAEMILTKRELDSIINSNEEKNIREGKKESGEVFFKPNWQRKYPVAK